MKTSTTLIPLCFALAATPVAADVRPAATTCSLGATTVENFEVPANTTCQLTGTRITGNLRVQTGGALIASAIFVGGDLQAEGARDVRVVDGAVGGSVQIKQGGRASVLRTTIEGDLQIDAMSGPLALRRNTIGGSLQAVQNRGTLEVLRNAIDGNLQCKENAIAPTGGSNVVQGVKEDQCAAL
jgi:hypothetical protein